MKYLRKREKVNYDGVVYEKEVNKFTIYISYFVTIFIIVMLGMLLLKIPDNLDIDYIKSIFIVHVRYFVAEKSEFITYAVLIFAFPIIFLGIHSILKKIIKPNCNIKIFNNIIEILSIILLNILLINSLFYYKFCIPLDDIFNSYLLILISMFIIFVLMLFKFSDRILIKRFLIFLSIMLTIWVSFYYLFGEFVQNNYTLHHFDAYFYPIKKIQSGLTPLVDFHSLYGGYAYFFVLVLSFFSKNYIIAFSIICALLFIISFYFLAYVSYKNINNKVLWFLFYCSIIFCNVVSFLYRFKSPYLQYVPHRIIFPAIILFYINYYIRKKSDNVALKLYGFVISSFALFWNLETGIIVLLTWFSFLVYEELYKNSFVYLKFKKFILFLMFLILLSIVFYLLMIIGITYLRTHKLINIFDLFFGITSFAGYGMYMVRMKLLHPWILLMIIYSVGLAISISNIKKFRKTKENFRDNAMFFALSVLGIGIFSYYQGRSVDMYFLLICYPGIILLGMYVDRLFVKKKRILLLPVLFIVSIVDISNLYYLCNEKINSEIKSDFIDNTSLTYVDLVKRFDNLDFIVPYESWYYDKYNLEDKKTFPSYVDLFKYSDIEKVINYLYVCENDVVMSRFELSIIKEWYYEDYKRLLNKYSKEKYDNRVVVLVLKDDGINDKE